MVKLSSPFPKGSFVEGQYKGKGAWFAGKVVKAHNAKSGVFAVDIRYDDGDQETRVDVARVRWPAAPPYAPADVPYTVRGHGEDTAATSTMLLHVASRERWQRALDELLAICDEAARRSSLRRDPHAEAYESPIAREFVEDRLQLDDPLVGWMARERATGRLQGFILSTTFTTWVAAPNFRWEHAKQQQHGEDQHKHKPGCEHIYPKLTPAIAELVTSLNACGRTGDPLTTGCVWPRVAEISLAGALGCGAALVHALLQRLRDGRVRNPADGGRYEFVVLQATHNAAAFYESVGFRHVGAAARHFTQLSSVGSSGGSSSNDGGSSVGGGSAPKDAGAAEAAAAAHDDSTQVVASSVGDWVPFRHFEYVVGDVEPSCMMALRLQPPVPVAAAGASAEAAAAETSVPWGHATGEVEVEVEAPGKSGVGAPAAAIFSTAAAGAAHASKRTEALAAQRQQELQQPAWFRDYLRATVRENAQARAAAAAEGAGEGAQSSAASKKRKLGATDGRTGALMRMLMRAGGGGGASPKKRKVNRHKKPKLPPQKTTMLSFFSRVQ